MSQDECWRKPGCHQALPRSGLLSSTSIHYPSIISKTLFCALNNMPSWFHRHENDASSSGSPTQSYQPPSGPPPGPPPTFPGYTAISPPAGLYAPPPGPPPGQYAPPPSFGGGLPGFGDSQSTQHFRQSEVNASEEDADRARRWLVDCYPPGSGQQQNQSLYAAKMLPSDAREYVQKVGARAWGLYNPKESLNWERDLAMYTDRQHMGSDIVISSDERSGMVTIVTAGGKDKNPFRHAPTKQCRDMCLLSTLPLLGGQYTIPSSGGWTGIYYEVTINYMKPENQCKDGEESGGVAIGQSYTTKLAGR